MGLKTISHSPKTMRRSLQKNIGSTREPRSFRLPETTVPQNENHPVAGDGCSSTKVVLPEIKNPTSCRGRPFQYKSCTARERKPIRLPETAVPVLNLDYNRTKIHPIAGDGCSSTTVVLPEIEILSSCRRWPFQSKSCTARERKSIRLPETAVPVLKLYYQRAKIHPVAGDGLSSTKLVLPENENPSGLLSGNESSSGCCIEGLPETLHGERLNHRPLTTTLWQYIYIYRVSTMMHRHRDMLHHCQTLGSFSFRDSWVPRVAQKDCQKHCTVIG